MWFFYLFLGGVCLFTKNYSDYSSIFTSVFCPPPLLKISSEFLFFWKASQDARSTVPSPNSALFSRIHVVCLGAWKGFRKLWRVLQWPYDPLKQKNPHLVIVACLCLKQTIQPTFCNFFFCITSKYCGKCCISELWLLLPFHLKEWLDFLFSVCTVPVATPQNTGSVPSLLALTKLPFISLGTGLLLVVSFHWEFFQLRFADKFFGKGKRRPWGSGLRCNFSVNVHLYFYTFFTFSDLGALHCSKGLEQLKRDFARNRAKSILGVITLFTFVINKQLEQQWAKNPASFTKMENYRDLVHKQALTCICYCTCCV